MKTIEVFRMKTITTHLLSPLILAIALVSGCAQQPAVTPTEDPRQLTDLATDILTKAVYVSSLFNLCTPLGDEAELEAITVQQDWIDKNWPAIIAADHYYTGQFGSQAMSYNGQPISLAAVLLAYNAKKRATDELNLKQRTLTNQQKTCVRRIQILAQQEMDLVASEQARADLLALQQQYTGDTTRVVPVPSLAGDVTTERENGRSYFVLSEEFKKECPEGQFIVLHNQWPREAYASYCGAVPVSLVSCEWGKCTTQQP